MKIGITESGDSSLKYEWTDKIDSVNGAIIITKNITDKFIKEILKHKDKCILHCSCTGYGRTKIEPKIPKYQKQIHQLSKLIDKGFPVEQVVLRVDPIIPTDKGLKLAKEVMEYAINNTSGLKRIRCSLLDMYPHVKKRFEKTLGNIPYDTFHAPMKMQEKADKLFKYILDKYPEVTIESCAEKFLLIPTKTGCVSVHDLNILNIEQPNELSLKFNRQNCLCIANKKELLDYTPNKVGYDNCYGCLYCYWKNEKEKE